MCRGVRALTPMSSKSMKNINNKLSSVIMGHPLSIIFLSLMIDEDDDNNDVIIWYEDKILYNECDVLIFLYDDIHRF